MKERGGGSEREWGGENGREGVHDRERGGGVSV